MSAEDFDGSSTALRTITDQYTRAVDHEFGEFHLSDLRTLVEETRHLPENTPVMAKPQHGSSHSPVALYVERTTYVDAPKAGDDA